MSFCEAPEQNSSLGIEDIRRQAEELVEDINQSRSNDQRVRDKFQDKFVQKMMEMCQEMTGHMHMIYEENSDEMQLQELSKVLENCSKLQNELLEASQALSRLKEDLTMIHKSD
ncbi:hypothetical protein OJAV_G00000390 [Oryzias javanicus]|uniref:Synaptonemal complex central element protein 2 n=1 Tax=Oryzias javanicus TaxID=123683 RepID=A0A3S2N832_ORYJA|nr:hypothetical protein OJAV_G00000390 [Oryzias javanicus]